MAETSVTPQATRSNSNGYQLPHAQRMAILAGSDSAKLAEKQTDVIEQQRQAFMRTNGDDGTH